MKWLLFLAPAILSAQTAADLAAQIRSAEFDAAECYRVRDLTFARDELRFYFTDGYLIFGKPIAGRRVSALFVREREGGDAEILLMPPTRGERISMARFTGTPNLNEHLLVAFLLFSDDTGQELLAAIRERGEPRKSPEHGLLLKQDYDSTLRNLSSSFVVRLVEHLMGEVKGPDGFLYAALTGRTLGNFDVHFDPSAREQIYVGSLASRDNRTFYDTWTSFAAKSFRGGQRSAPSNLLRVDQFRIEAVLEPNLHLRVHTEATVVPSARPLRVLPFDLSAGMRVTAVRVNGEPAEFFARESLRSNLIRRSDSVQFLVVAPELCEPGRAYQVEFEHEGDVITSPDKKVFFVGSRGNWYPRSGTSYARYDLTFSYPSNLDLVFPGDLKDEKVEGDLKTTRRVTSEPIRLAGFNLGHYESAKATRGGLTVQVFANQTAEQGLRRREEIVMLPPPAPPFGRMPNRRPEMVTLPAAPEQPDPTARMEALTEEVATAFEFLASRFGPPALPSLMVSPIPGTFGQGFPGLVYLSTLAYLDPRHRPEATKGATNELFFSELLHTHEAAHQWWGNVVTSASPQDDWLMESLANYSALLMLERRKGPRALRSLLESYKVHLLEPDAEGKTLESSGPVRLGMRLQSSQAPTAWRTIVYEKGTWIIHMLRRRLGDERFHSLLAEVCRKYRYQTLSTEQFRLAAAAALPRGAADPQLEAFFEQWVNDTGIPALKLNVTTKGKAPAVKVTLTLTQSEVDEKFSISVPVDVQIARGQSRTVWLQTGSEPVSETLSLRAPPAKVTLDPEDSLLAIRK